MNSDESEHFYTNVGKIADQMIDDFIHSSPSKASKLWYTQKTFEVAEKTADQMIKELDLGYHSQIRKAHKAFNDFRYDFAEYNGYLKAPSQYKTSQIDNLEILYGTVSDYLDGVKSERKRPINLQFQSSNRERELELLDFTDDIVERLY